MRTRRYGPWRGRRAPTTRENRIAGTAAARSAGAVRVDDERRVAGLQCDEGTLIPKSECRADRVGDRADGQMNNELECTLRDRQIRQRRPQ